MRRGGFEPPRPRAEVFKTPVSTSSSIGADVRDRTRTCTLFRALGPEPSVTTSSTTQTYARDRTRTCTALRPPAPQAGVTTSSTTRAKYLGQDSNLHTRRAPEPKSGVSPSSTTEAWSPPTSGLWLEAANDPSTVAPLEESRDSEDRYNASTDKNQTCHGHPPFVAVLPRTSEDSNRNGRGGSRSPDICRVKTALFQLSYAP